MEGETEITQDASAAQAALPPPLPVIPLDAPVRFCRQCGAARDPATDLCPTCTDRAALATNRTSMVTDAVYQDDLSAVKGSTLLYFSLLGVSVIGIIVALSQSNRISPQADFVLTGFFIGVVMLFCIVNWRDLIPVLRCGAGIGWFFAVLPVACATYLLASGSCHLMHLAGMPLLRYSTEFIGHGYGWDIVILMICVEPAIFEELAFRGIIQTSLSRVLGGNDAVWVTALMFAILHLSIPSMPHLLLLGLALGFLRKKTGSLYPGMLLHFSHNFLVIMAERWRFGPW